MTCRSCTRRSKGFTLIELAITLAIIGVLASIALPLTEIAVKRTQEQELKASLRQIREAIDAYKQAVDEGHIARGVNESGYPKTLESLVDGVEDIKDLRHTKIYFLRQLPRDPLYPDSTVEPSLTWGKRSYESSRENPEDGDDVFDIYSRAEGEGLNGVLYREW